MEVSIEGVEPIINTVTEESTNNNWPENVTKYNQTSEANMEDSTEFFCTHNMEENENNRANNNSNNKHAGSKKITNNDHRDNKRSWHNNDEKMKKGTPDNAIVIFENNVWKTTPQDLQND